MAFPTFVLFGLLTISTACAAKTTAFVNELEHLLVDAQGFNDAGLKRGVTPCVFYNAGPQTAGRMSSAQWMRVAFHDFATADVKAGTGGMDASIGWETNREENHGAAMNDSMGFFAPFVNKYVSMADMIALGTVVASGACDGPLMPYKGGRIDATEGGAFGVPEPQGTLEEHIERFATAGFSQTEMIELTACGHTIGSVHQGGFPDIVQNAVTPNNTNGGIHFDDTGDVFDNHVATGYLDDTTTNPLVKSFNVTVRSDLRIFSSDKNKTMKKLAASPQFFASRCTTVFTKMLNTVPKGVKLTDIKPIDIKPVNVQINVDASGAVVLTGAIRLLSSMGFPPNAQRTVTIDYQARDGSDCASPCTTQAKFDPNTTKGTSLFGDTFYHLFSLKIDPKKGISSFNVAISENSGDNHGGVKVKTFDIQDTAFFLPSASTLSTDASGKVIGTIAAAVLQSASPLSVVASLDVPVAQIGTQAPHVTNFKIPLQAVGPLGLSGFILYTSTHDAAIPGVTTLTNAFRSSVDIIVKTPYQTVTDDFNKLSVLNTTQA